jgi:hypothetical protein
MILLLVKLASHWTAWLQQEAYSQLGLPRIISQPLAAKSVPRAEVAAAVLAILLDKDLTISRLNTRLARVEGEHKALVQRYMQLRGLVGMQGIIGEPFCWHIIFAVSCLRHSKTCDLLCIGHLSRMLQAVRDCRSHHREAPCCLHAEYAEEGMASQPQQGNGSRVRSWEEYLARKPELRTRIASETRWHPSWIPGRWEVPLLL